MLKKILFIGVGAALLAAPLVSSAATLNDLQAQIQSLLSQIQAQSGASASISGTAVASPVVPPCVSLNRSLSIGAQGSDVTTLQQFLSAQGYLNVSATGYFGALTKAAVGRWQLQNGIAVSGNAGFGVFGPLSRSYLNRSCGTTTSQQTLSADPQSGAAPLAVTFTTSDSIANTAVYAVDFGDGQNASMTKGSCIAITAIVGGQGGIRCSYSVSHTYTANGTYTAHLTKNTCPAGAECFAGPLTVASATVTVGSSTNTNTSFTASPTSGAAPLTVQFISTAPQGTNIGNTVNFGDGASANLGFVPTCSSCNAEGTATHTYASAGTYTATLTSGACACPANGICNCPNMQILGTATITVGPSGSNTSSIQQLNAPGSVSLQQNGIAEIRNENYYFTLQSLSPSSATIQVTQVGCWNSFPSDTPPQIRCMIAVVPVPPQTLAIGQTYASTNYGITLTQITNGTATFSISTPSSQ
jgi:PKD repeat protein